MTALYSLTKFRHCGGHPSAARRRLDPGRHSTGVRERGFTLLEVMIATILLSLGLLTLAFAVGHSVLLVQSAQQDTVARQKARETIESVTTTLNTQNLSFDSICPLSGGASCIFVEGFTPLYQAGADGIFGTLDDAAAGLQTVPVPGPDGLLSDGVSVPLTAFQRKVVITTIAANLKQVTVTIRYATAGGYVRDVTLTTYVSPYT